jgi:hypothetical protein
MPPPLPPPPPLPSMSMSFADPAAMQSYASLVDDAPWHRGTTTLVDDEDIRDVRWEESSMSWQWSSSRMEWTTNTTNTTTRR